jgi:hypothetical protein
MTITLAIALLGTGALAPQASAQWPSAGRTEVVVAQSRGGGRDGRVRQELDRLNRDVRRVREEIRRRGASRRTQRNFNYVARMTVSLNEHYRRGRLSSWEIRHRTQDIRTRLSRIEWELRRRG